MNDSRLYKPHSHDAVAVSAAINASASGAIQTTAEERAALRAVINAFDVGGYVTQHDICRAHDVIERHKQGKG